MQFSKMIELKKIVNANLQVVEKVTQPTRLGIELAAKFLGATSYAQWADEYASDVMLAIDAQPGTRPSINRDEAKAFFGGAK